ncbi:MAG: DNA polymerase III subunit gamma/tau [Patescibacteria group bacterium]|nr:DNA polymerase III subunit gamma/tau [Patescibacteria group bacterium]
MAFYLTYRPKIIKDLDLTQVRESLTEILGAKEIPHAFLFSGPKGTGKTSSARILAKAVNCSAKQNAEPCNKCDGCKMIESGRSMDLIEIDAASNRGIDDIRELRDKIKLVPSQAKFKVYIIDEVHMLTNEAFNALLKTLEEPPLHAKFVLCTTQAEKLPGTILSRCFVINFNKANHEEIKRSLTRVVKGEKLKISDEDLGRIARVSDGSFRDAVKVLEQLAAGGKVISGKKVSQVLDRGLGTGTVDEWLEMVYLGKTVKALEWLEAGMNQGLNLSQFISQVLERLRQVLLGRLGVETVTEDIKVIDDLAKLKKLIWRLLQAGRELKGAVIESLPLELAVIDWQGEIELKEEVQVEAKVEAKNVKLEQVLSRWKEILEEMRPLNHSLEALLKATKPVEFDGKCLTLEVFYKFHKDRLEENRYRQMVEKVISKVLIQSITIKYYLGEKNNHEGDMIKNVEEVFGVGVS